MAVFPHLTSLTLTTVTPPFATLLQISWLPCCPSDTPNKLCAHSLCILLFYFPRMLFSYISRMFVSFVFLLKCDFITETFPEYLTQKNNTPSNSAWVPNPDLFIFVTHITVSVVHNTTYFLVYFRLPSLRLWALWRQKWYLLCPVLTFCHLEHFLAHGKHSIAVEWKEGCIWVERKWNEVELEIYLGGRTIRL